jgi:hypothetical protein
MIVEVSNKNNSSKTNNPPISTLEQIKEMLKKSVGDFEKKPEDSKLEGSALTIDLGKLENSVIVSRDPRQDKFEPPKMFLGDQEK